LIRGSDYPLRDAAKEPCAVALDPRVKPEDDGEGGMTAKGCGAQSARYGLLDLPEPKPCA
jgi:hypothetical protein